MSIVSEAGRVRGNAELTRCTPTEQGSSTRKAGPLSSGQVARSPLSSSSIRARTARRGAFGLRGQSSAAKLTSALLRFALLTSKNGNEYDPIEDLLEVSLAELDASPSLPTHPSSRAPFRQSAPSSTSSSPPLNPPLSSVTPPQPTHSAPSSRPLPPAPPPPPIRPVHPPSPPHLSCAPWSAPSSRRMVLPS